MNLLLAQWRAVDGASPRLMAILVLEIEYRARRKEAKYNHILYIFAPKSVNAVRRWKRRRRGAGPTTLWWILLFDYYNVWPQRVRESDVVFFWCVVVRKSFFHNFWVCVWCITMRARCPFDGARRGIRHRIARRHMLARFSLSKGGALCGRLLVMEYIFPYHIWVCVRIAIQKRSFVYHYWDVVERYEKH